LYPAKLSFTIKREIKILHNIQKQKEFVTTKPALKKILKSYTQKRKINTTMKT
jgi:hypothetical protein